MFTGSLYSPALTGRVLVITQQITSVRYRSKILCLLVCMESNCCPSSLSVTTSGCTRQRTQCDVQLSQSQRHATRLTAVDAVRGPSDCYGEQNVTVMNFCMSRHLRYLEYSSRWAQSLSKKPWTYSTEHWLRASLFLVSSLAGNSEH